jgi:hypothetical protein
MHGQSSVDRVVVDRSIAYPFAVARLGKPFAVQLG